ncbi:ABC transporter substrate-binding protein [Zongyangia hominis]|uniref:ABC transporter substrate-binding protein n=1 Tax=Zongyangia hominis TaxID=2763677 RepID=A0A926IAP0_9FIRM|nr:ABC transporter substrate-binding protein [Zongyangia hominis]MBC8569310.1 ABC transporter substrate-binding protein [Zongyangia hominis]
MQIGKQLTAFLLSTCLCLGLLAGCGKPPAPGEGGSLSASGNTAIRFTDDEGREIRLDGPCRRIISLYSAHTENLFTLGAGEQIIGVSDTSIYPPEAAALDIYDYQSDPEKVIAAQPDLVLIRPFITDKAPDFVKAIENAGIPVVSLYPEKFELFDEYIAHLGSLVGKEEEAKEKLAEFHRNLDAIGELTAQVKTKQRVFFESTEVNLRTITADSMPAHAIALAGGENVAGDVSPVKAGSSIAPFGEEKVLSLADSIDVYVSQSGAMNAGGSVHGISIRPGFDTIQAVKDGRVYLINEKIISSPTFRFYKGVRELARYLYPEIMDDLAAYENDEAATRRDLANIMVKAAHLPIYVTSSSKYYKQDHKGHVYGWFEDVAWTDPDFDAIETVVTSGYLDWEKDGIKQLFHPEDPVTREELAQAIFLMGDYERGAGAAIADLDACENKNIVQIMVDNGVFALIDGKFEPERAVTQREIVEAFAKAGPLGREA